MRLIPPASIKPFVKRQNDDAADGEAICEAAQRPPMRFVAVKSEEPQASAPVFRGRLIGFENRFTKAGQSETRAGTGLWVQPARHHARPPAPVGRQALASARRGTVVSCNG